MSARLETAISDESRRTGVERHVIRAVIMQESGMRPFGKDGAPLSRFEPHHIPAALRRRIGLPERYTWRDSLALGESSRRRLYAASLGLDPEATHRATSYGVGQIMGFNHQAAGFDTATEMFRAFSDEGKQVAAMMRFISSRPGAIAALRGRDWLTFAETYNGSGQPGVYAAKIEAHYRRLSGQASPVVLRVGARGPAVTELQRALVAAGFMAESDVDGAFGPGTETAVRSFQEVRGLTTDGVVGARTWEALRRAEPSAKPPAQPVPEPAADFAETAGKIGAGAAAATAAAKQVAEALDATAALIPPVVAEWLPVGVAVALGAGLALWVGAEALRRFRERVA